MSHSNYDEDVFENKYLIEENNKSAFVEYTKPIVENFLKSLPEKFNNFLDSCIEENDDETNG